MHISFIRTNIVNTTTLWFGFVNLRISVIKEFEQNWTLNERDYQNMKPKHTYRARLTPIFLSKFDQIDLIKLIWASYFCPTCPCGNLFMGTKKVFNLRVFTK